VPETEKVDANEDTGSSFRNDAQRHRRAAVRAAAEAELLDDDEVTRFEAERVLEGLHPEFSTTIYGECKRRMGWEGTGELVCGIFQIITPVADTMELPPRLWPLAAMGAGLKPTAEFPPAVVHQYDLSGTFTDGKHMLLSPLWVTNRKKEGLPDLSAPPHGTVDWRDRWLQEANRARMRVVRAPTEAARRRCSFVARVGGAEEANATAPPVPARTCAELEKSPTFATDARPGAPHGRAGTCRGAEGCHPPAPEGGGRPARAVGDDAGRGIVGGRPTAHKRGRSRRRPGGATSWRLDGASWPLRGERVAERGDRLRGGARSCERAPPGDVRAGVRGRRRRRRARGCAGAD